MPIKLKQKCPMCGGTNISNVKSSRSPIDFSLSATGGIVQKDDPPDVNIPPITDFNHPYYCNSCKNFFGGHWGGIALDNNEFLEQIKKYIASQKLSDDKQEE